MENNATEFENAGIEERDGGDDVLGFTKDAAFINGYEEEFMKSTLEEEEQQQQVQENEGKVTALPPLQYLEKTSSSIDDKTIVIPIVGIDCHRNVLINSLRQVISTILREHGKFFKIIIAIPPGSHFLNSAKSQLESSTANMSNLSFHTIQQDDCFSNAKYVLLPFHTPNYNCKVSKYSLMGPDKDLEKNILSWLHESLKQEGLPNSCVSVSSAFHSIYNNQDALAEEATLSSFASSTLNDPFRGCFKKESVRLIEGRRRILIALGMPSFVPNNEDFAATFRVSLEADLESKTRVLFRLFHSALILAISHRIQFGNSRLYYFLFPNQRLSNHCLIYTKSNGFFVDRQMGKQFSWNFYNANFRELDKNYASCIYMLEIVALETNLVQYRYVGSTIALRRRVVYEHIPAIINGDDSLNGAPLLAKVGHRFYRRYRNLNFLKLSVVQAFPNGSPTLREKFHAETKNIIKYKAWAGLPGGLNLALPARDEHTHARFNKHLKGVSLEFFFKMDQFLEFNRDCAMQELFVFIERDHVEKNKLTSFAEWAEWVAGEKPGVMNGTQVVGLVCHLVIDWDKIKYMTFSRFLNWLSIMTTPKRNKQNELRRPYAQVARGEDGFYVFSDCFFFAQRKHRFWPVPMENVAYEEKLPGEVEEDWENVMLCSNSKRTRKGNLPNPTPPSPLRRGNYNDDDAMADNL